jgi:hypothetical protein
MGRQVRTLGFRAQVTQKTLIYYLHEVGFVDAVYFERFRLIDQVKQCGE